MSLPRPLGASQGPPPPSCPPNHPRPQRPQSAAVSSISRAPAQIENRGCVSTAFAHVPRAFSGAGNGRGYAVAAGNTPTVPREMRRKQPGAKPFAAQNRAENLGRDWAHLALASVELRRGQGADGGEVLGQRGGGERGGGRRRPDLGTDPLVCGRTAAGLREHKTLRARAGTQGQERPERGGRRGPGRPKQLRERRRNGREAAGRSRAGAAGPRQPRQTAASSPGQTPGVPDAERAGAGAWGAPSERSAGAAAASGAAPPSAPPAPAPGSGGIEAGAT